MKYPFVIYEKGFFPRGVISFCSLSERESLLLKEYSHIVFITKKDINRPKYDVSSNFINAYPVGMLLKPIVSSIPSFKQKIIPRLMSNPNEKYGMFESVSEVKLSTFHLEEHTVEVEMQRPFRTMNDIESVTITLELIMNAIHKMYLDSAKNKKEISYSERLIDSLFALRELDDILNFGIEFLIQEEQITRQEFYEQYLTNPDIERQRLPFVVSKLKLLLNTIPQYLPKQDTLLTIAAKGTADTNDFSTQVREQKKLEKNEEDQAKKSLSDKFPDYVKKRIEELEEKLNMSARDTGERALTYRYLKLLESIPWGIDDNEPLNFSELKKELEELQYGMIEPKNKIEQLVAVSINSGKPLSGKTICIIGAPGVGKTMFAMNIAKVLKRKFTKISLAGINDVTLLRGQIKGWIGAEPGLIIKALISAGSMNPVIVLDEIDKITGYHGEQVKSALLEILDPNQNHLFQDAWVDLPIDLSKIIFIATANYWRNIPLALEDRMEIIRISNYSLQEKFEISRRYIIPKVYEKTAVTEQEITIAEGALDKIVMSHKSDPGVRKIEQDLTELISKYVVTKVEGKVNGPFEVNEQNLSTFLILDEDGNNFDPDDKKIGQINVLSVTQIDGLSVSGRRNTIQVAAIPGKGELKYTGSLSDVKKESIDVAIGYLKTHAQQFDIPEDYFQKHDIFYHQSPLSTPKDGPSATIATTLCMLSVIKNLPIPQNIAVTGEMDLQGAAMPIGGVKDKIQSAVVDKVTVFVLPERNRSDYEKDVPDEIKQSITIHFVKHFTECLAVFFPEFQFQK